MNDTPKVTFTFYFDQWESNIGVIRPTCGDLAELGHGVDLECHSQNVALCTWPNQRRSL